MKTLLERRAKLAKEIRTLADRQAEWTAEDRANWEKLNKDYDGVQAEISQRQETERVVARSAEIAGHLEQPAGDRSIGREDTGSRQAAGGNGRERSREEQRALAMQGWLRAQEGLAVTDEQREACAAEGVHPQQRHLDIRLPNSDEYRRLREGHRRGLQSRAAMSLTDNVGGYTIPTGFVNDFEQARLAFGGPREVASILRTDTGNDLHWPTANDTGNKGEMLAEATTIGTSVAPAVSEKIFYAYKMSSKLLQISSELLQDSAFQLVTFIAAWLGERIGRIEADYYTTGTGSSQPQGCVTGSTAGKTTASATAITTDEVLDLIHSVDPAYRPTSRFMMHDSVLLYLRKLKDGEGNYIWQAGTVTAEPDRIFGFPITVNQSMASTVEASAKTMLFGDFSKFKIRDVASIRLRRLVERYADLDQEGFVAFTRTDSGVLDAGTHPLKHMVQHA